MWSRFTATTAERFFRIDRALEPAHYVTDIASQDLFIVDPDLHTSFLAPTIVYGSDGDDVTAAVPVPAAGSPWPARGTSPPPHLSLTAANGTAANNSIHYGRYDYKRLCEKELVCQLKKFITKSVSKFVFAQRSLQPKLPRRRYYSVS